MRPSRLRTSSSCSSRMCEPLVPPIMVEGAPRACVDAVDPRAGGIDDDASAGCEKAPPVGCAKVQHAARGRGQRRVVGGRGAGVRLQPVLHQFEHQPLGVADLGVVVGAGGDDRWRSGRHVAQGAASPDQPVARHHPAARSVEIVDHQADLDEHGATAARRAGRAEQRAQRRARCPCSQEKIGISVGSGLT